MMAMFLTPGEIIFFPYHGVEDLLDLSGITGRSVECRKATLIVKYIRLDDEKWGRLARIFEERRKRRQWYPHIEDRSDFPAICVESQIDFYPARIAQFDVVSVPLATDVMREFKDEFVDMERNLIPRPTISLAEEVVCLYVDQIRDLLKPDPLEEFVQM
jgi:hypothetical protein